MTKTTRVLGYIALPVMFLATSAGLFYFLFYMGARPAIDAYVKGVRAGAKVKPRNPDRDSREANEEIAKSTDLTVTNFRSLSSWGSGTGCYWAKLETPGYFRDITFFVEKNDDGWFVSRVSLTRRCDCAKSVGCKMD